MKPSTCFWEHWWVSIFLQVNVISQEVVASDSLIKDDKIQGRTAAADKYRPCLWSLSWIAWDGRGGGPEPGMERTRRVTPDGSPAGVPGVKGTQGDEAAARETPHTTGPGRVTVAAAQRGLSHSRQGKSPIWCERVRVHRFPLRLWNSPPPSTFSPSLPFITSNRWPASLVQTCVKLTNQGKKKRRK